MNDILKSNCFKKDISRMSNISEEYLTEYCLEHIEYISWSKKDFSGHEKDYDTEELQHLKNLKSCTFGNFKFDEKDIDNINFVSSLKFVYFDFCEFELKKIFFSENIETIIFNMCVNLKLSMLKDSLAKKIKIVGSEMHKQNVDIKDLGKCENLEELSINNFTVKNIERVFEVAPNVKYLNLNGSIIKNRDMINQLNIKIENEEKYYIFND